MNKFIKKAAAVVLAGALMAATFVGCSSSSTEENKVYNVGICQLVQHDALDAATKGFKDVLTEKLGDKVVFDEQNASGDSATCATITNQFVANGVDLIMANATPALQAAMASTAEIPIVGTSVTEYGVALEIKDFSGQTGMNITGTSDLAPLTDQAAMVMELCPEAKTVGLLYCTAEANSVYQVDVVKAELEKNGITCKTYGFADSNDVSAVVTTACSEVEAIYVPTDNTAASNTELINNIAEPAGIPIVAGEEGICKGCGIATLSISYYDLGRQTGEMAYEILVNGADPATMDIAYTPESGLTKKYMADRSKALGVVIPEGYTAIEE